MSVPLLLNVKQNEVGHVRSGVTEVTSTSTIALKSNNTLVLNNASNIAVTISTTPKDGDYLEIYCLDTNDGSTVTLPSGVTWDGTNNIATFDADNEKIICRAFNSTRWLVLSNPDSVAFSS